jgi:hypothetical protein
LVLLGALTLFLLLGRVVVAFIERRRLFFHILCFERRQFDIQ